MSDESPCPDVPSLSKRVLKRIFGNRLATFLAWALLASGLALLGMRASMNLVPLLEDEANAWLRERFDARLFGLHADWHGVTPRLHIHSILFRRGAIEDIQVGFDLGSSLWTRSPRVSAFEIGNAEINFPEDFDLINFLLKQEGQFDLMSMFEDAELLSGNLVMRVGEDSEALVLRWSMQASGMNRGCVQLLAQSHASGEGLVMSYDLDHSLFDRRFEGSFWAHGRLHIPDSFTSLLGTSGAISSLDAEMRILEGRLSALAKADARNLRVGSYLIDHVELLAKGKGTPWLVEGELGKALFQSGDVSFDLEGTLFSFDEHWQWNFNFPALLFQQLADFAVAAAREDTALARWSERFAPEGALSDIIGRKSKGEPLVLAASFHELSADSWMGSPAIEQMAGRLVFAAGKARAIAESPVAIIELPKLFDQSFEGGRTSGEVWAMFLPQYAGIRGFDLRSELPRGGSLVINLNYSGPRDPDERQISGRIAAQGLIAEDALAFLPKRLDQGMKDWLRRGVRGGVLDRGEILLSGYVRRRPEVPSLSMEMWADWVDGTLAYHPQWPNAEAISARVELIGGRLKGNVKRARMLGALIEDLRLKMPWKGRRFDLNDSGVSPADVFVELIGNTPFGRVALGKVGEVDAQGQVAYRMSASLPLDFESSGIEFALDLNLQGVDLSFPQLMASRPEALLSALAGNLSYRFPDQLSGDGIQGFLFGQPATISLRTDALSVDGGRPLQVELRSRIDHGALNAFSGRILPLTGVADYAALVELDPNGQVSPRVRARSELRGIEARIPGGLGKLADESVPFLMDLTVDEGLSSGEALFSLADRVGGLLTWRNLGATDPQISGTLAFGPAHSQVEVARRDAQDVRIRGSLPELVLSDLGSFASAHNDFPLVDVSVEGLRLGRLTLGQTMLENLTIHGSMGATGFDLSFAGESLEGSWTSARQDVSKLEFNRIHLQPLSQDETRVADLIEDLDLKSLPEVDLSARSIKIGENDYGAWRLGLRQLEDGVRLVNVQAELRGLTIRAQKDLIWRQLADGGHETRFVGELITDDLADAMAQWGFAPSVEAERAQLTANLRWPEVPWQPKLEALNGEMSLIIRRGRFRDFDPGAGMKLLSLLDFNAFISRLTLDFSDVFDEGVAFDEVNVKSQFENGKMRMLEPAKIDGNGGQFLINGSIDLETQELDNQLEATLKISRSLPWLATYLALLGNPVTGLSVVVAERVLRDRIEDVSTARYYVTGTLNEPVFSLSEVEEPEPVPEELINPDASGEEPSTSRHP